METPASMSSYISVRERRLATALLGLGLITFAIDASNTTLGMIMTFLTFRFIAGAFVASPNNLATLEALPESKVYMATALSGLLRSIANTMGTAIAAVLWDQRYNYHIQQFAEDTPLDTFGFTAALGGFQRTLQWAGEHAAQIPTQT